LTRNGVLRGTLYVIATPIGNLDDLSPRAVAALAGSRLIACEDTRRTRVILARHGLKTRLLSYHRFNEAGRLETLLQTLRRGDSIALTSDGGTPAISDPGALLVRRAREEGHRIVPVPGASAITALLSASGFPAGPFTFIGFLPRRKGERRRQLEALRRETRPLLFFESPHRLVESLGDALDILGDREIVLGREMTKVHEEFCSGTIAAVRADFAGREVKGEVAFVVAGADAREPAAASSVPTGPLETPAAAVRRLVAAGWDRKEAMRRVARERGLSRRQVYRDLLQPEEDG
jgi:16S rRNA (cytidine1402-2'-O)-methyltransferase